MVRNLVRMNVSCLQTEEVEKAPMMLEVAMRPNIVNRLKEQLELLDRIQKGLNVFLDFKRGLFPRMAFLSNDELLEVLVSCQQPKFIQPHLIKMFSVRPACSKGCFALPSLKPCE